MTAMDLTDNDLNRAQSKFVKGLKTLAMTHDVAVILVAHPRKTISVQKSFDNDDVSGSADITNRVDVIMSYSRNEDKTNPDDTMQPDSKLVITKNRLTGKITPKDNPIEMYYSNKSKRITTMGTNQKQYGWETGKEVPVFDWLEDDDS